MVSTTKFLDHPAANPADVVRPATVVVRKYGGSSLATADHVRAVAAELAALCDREARIVVVVSAMGDTTDQLAALARTFADQPDRRELDQLVATGEQVSAAILALALAQQGVPAVSLSGGQAGIRVRGQAGAGVIDHVDPSPALRRLRKHRVVVVAGFQGRDADGELLTLGRGGSDATAVALAAALGRAECVICTDVHGVYTADPRVVPDARLLTVVGAGLMGELARQGARVLQAESVELAARHGIRVRVVHSAHPGPGTVVDPDPLPVGGSEVVAIAHRRAAGGEPGSVSLVGTALADPDILETLVRTLDERSIAGDMTASTSRITVALDDEAVEPAVQALHAAFGLHRDRR
ncbi:aspartate kinase [Amycolatopsis sp. NPDC005003]